MNEIILKIPRRKKKVRIIKSKEELIDFIQDNESSKRDEKRKKELEQLKKEELKLKEQELERQKKQEEDELLVIGDKAEKFKIEKSKEQFTEMYSISGEGKPLEISMDKVAIDMLSIDEAMIEVQEAYDRGFEDGKEAANIAYQAEVNKYADWIRRIDVVIDEIENKFSRELEKFSNSLVKATVLVSEKIINKEVSKDTDIILSQVKKAIRNLDENDTIIRITLHPEDQKIIEQAKSRIVSDDSRLKKTKIATNTEIQRGGCVLTTSAGELDARISTQLDKIKDIFQKTIEESSTIAPSEDV